MREVEQRPQHAGGREARALKSARQKAPRNGRAASPLVPVADRLGNPSPKPPLQAARGAAGKTGKTGTARRPHISE
jgi:hypothetical protein